MTFLAPGALIGLALLAIPILIHLFKPRRVRQTPFSSLRWLHLTQQRMARRIEWHQVLLFLLRAGLITALVVALARPLYLPKDDGAAARDRLVIIDVSRSMRCTLEGRPRPIDVARDAAADALRGLQPGERAAVVACGTRATLVSPWITDGAAAIRSVQSLEPGPTATRLDASLTLARSLLSVRPSRAPVELLVLTDATAGSWSSGGVAAFVGELTDEERKALSVRIVDVGLPASRNGWIADARVRRVPEGAVLRVECRCVGETTQSRRLSLTWSGTDGGDSTSTDVVLDPGRAVAVDLKLGTAAEGKTGRVKLSLDPPDELPDDDEFFVSLDARGATHVVLIEPETAGDDSQRPGFALRTAIQSLVYSGARDVEIVARTPASATADEIESADVVWLADVPGLNATLGEAISRRVARGGGAALFLGPRVDAQAYNARFVSPLRPSEGLLPAALGAVVQVSDSKGGLSPWERWDDRHPVVNGLLDPLLGDLGGARSKAYFRFERDVPGTDETAIIARMDDGTPALMLRRLGQGRVAILNASPNDAWCDLPRRASFVPLVDRLLTHLAGHLQQRSFAAGEPVVLRVPQQGKISSATVRAPSGATLTPRVEQDDAGASIRIDGLVESGFHELTTTAEPTATGGQTPLSALTNSAGPRTLVVQPSRDDSPLAPMPAETLRSWWHPLDVDLVASSSVGRESRSVSAAVNLESTLLILAAALFLAEMVLVHALCPRINPALAAAPGRRKGFVAPLKLRGDATD